MPKICVIGCLTSRKDHDLLKLSQSNPHVSMYDTISTLYHMKQGNNKSNDHYLAHFKSNITAVKLIGGEHIFFSPILAGCNKNELSQEEVDIEEGKFKAI